ncbi:MAG: M1 family aminopeptidase [Ginsengibacter sp.]
MRLKIIPSLVFFAVILCNIKAWSQLSNASIKESSYNYHEAFKKGFYPNSGNVYRTSGGQPGIYYWQNRADYRILASINDKTNEIKGQATIIYKNNSPDELDFLWLYLEQNLFAKDSRGSAILSDGASLENVNGQKFEGGIKIKSLKVISAKDGKSWLNAKYIITDTRIQVWLPQKLAAKTGKTELIFEYTYNCPVNGANRTGILSTKNGKIYSVAQWYPRMCVYDDVSGWNTVPYLGPSEFYSEYGNFDISITTPASYAVLCSGELLNPSEVYSETEIKRWSLAKSSDQTVTIRSKKDVETVNANPPAGKKTWHFRIINARDAAWACSPAFIITAARINLPSGNKSMAISAYPEESDSATAWIRATEYGKASIEYYSNKWFEYPYPTAINIASNVGGMEYPGIVFCGWKKEERGLWDATDHEESHNWFPMIVGSNEKWHGWMDEGFSVFINGLSSAAFNNGEYKGGNTDMHLESDRFTNQKLEPVMSAPTNMKKENIATLLYFKPAAGLTLLRNQVLGIERFDLAFKTYIKRWAYKHPTPEDFFRTMENVSGEDLSWFWRGWFLYNWQLDQAIASVSYVDNDPSKGVLITIDNLEKMPMPVELELKTKSGKSIRFKLPVEIWESNKTFIFKPPVAEELVSVVLDPDRVLPDINTANNSWITSAK